MCCSLLCLDGLFVCCTVCVCVCLFMCLHVCLCVFVCLLITSIHGPSFVRARYCSVKIGLWIRHMHLCCEVPDVLNEFESCSSCLFR